MYGKLAKKGHTRLIKWSVAEMELTDEDASDVFEYD